MCNLAEFRNVCQNTPCTVCHPAMACLAHWCCETVLADGVRQHNVLQKWCNFTRLCAQGSEGFFPRGAQVDFSRSFSRGRQKQWYLVLTTRN